jgi:hypothetical protein
LITTLLGFGIAVSDVAMTAHGITIEKWKQSVEMGKFGALNGIGECLLLCNDILCYAILERSQ